MKFSVFFWTCQKEKNSLCCFSIRGATESHLHLRPRLVIGPIDLTPKRPNCILVSICLYRFRPPTALGGGRGGVVPRRHGHTRELTWLAMHYTILTDDENKFYNSSWWTGVARSLCHSSRYGKSFTASNIYQSSPPTFPPSPLAKLAKTPTRSDPLAFGHCGLPDLSKTSRVAPCWAIAGWTIIKRGEK
jgi:hypothetical protein